MKIVILTFILSLNAFSYCKVKVQKPEGKIEVFSNQILEIADKAWEAATEKEVKNTKCAQRALSLKEMEEYLNSTDDTDKLFDMLINKRSKTLLSEEILTDLSKYNLSNCKSSICKAKVVFGDEEGIKLMYLLKKYGLNGSHLVHEDTRPWKSKELDMYLAGLRDTPSFMFPIDKNKQFTRSSKEDSALANASITFFDGMDKLNPTMVRYTVFHELAHYVSGEIGMEDDSHWQHISHWKEDEFRVKLIEMQTNKPSKFDFNTSINTTPLKPNNNLSLGFGKKPATSLDIFNTDVKIGKDFNSIIKKTRIMTEAMKNEHKHTIISQYGETNPLEDIAESIVSYRYSPNRLKEVSIDKYNYIKENIFQGIEYTDQKKCSTFDEQKLRKNLQDKINGI